MSCDMKVYRTLLFASGNKFLLTIMISILMIFSCIGQVLPQTKYINATIGNDLNDGNSPMTAWNTLGKINNSSFGPGDTILFKAGEKWYGVLKPKGSGEKGASVVIDRFGPGPRPEIHGKGLEAYTVLLENQEYWEINNLRITNFEEVDKAEEPARKRGIYVRASDMGPVRHVHLYNLEVDSVNSENSSFTSRYYGGIFFEVTGSEIPTYFDDILVDSCYIHDLSRTGISNTSSWATRILTTSFGQYIGKDNNGNDRYDNWVPSNNIVVKRNTLRRIAGNGIIIRAADKPRIEHNYLDSCGLYISGNAAFCFNTDSAVFQYNEACYTVYNEGDTDARGIDSDYRTKHTIIQYNYLHHNEYGGVVATGGSGSSAWLETFNDGTVIRYNILADNRDHILRTSGKLTNLIFHNNVLYTSDTDGMDSVKIVYNGEWGGAYARNLHYYNNIFLHLAANPDFDFGRSYNNRFEHNLFYGNRAANEPEDPHKIVGDPLLLNPGTDDLDGYMISRDSPAIGAGKVLSGHPANDFFGNPIPPDGPVDLGIHQVSGPLTVSRNLTAPADLSRLKILLYPNPTVGTLKLKLESGENYLASWAILENNGSETEISGRSWLPEGTSQVHIELNNTSLFSGIYIFRISDVTGNYIHKHFLLLN